MDRERRPVVRFASDDDVVKTGAAIGQEDDDRLPAGEPGMQTSQAALELDWTPSAPSYCLDERSVGNPSGTAIDERCELQGIGVGIAPVAKHHRGRRAAAQGVGLRQVRTSIASEAASDSAAAS